jgi:ABC-2 type transport system ATP-binding protein
VAVHAVDGVSFEVRRGEFFGILGPNGAGKTTLLEIIEGLRRPDGGAVTVLGERPWPRNLKLLPKIGVQLQASSFFERLTAREQIHTFARLYGVPARQADEWLAVVGLADQADQRNEKLSGGQQQRLSLACALVHGPDLVFLDEPTAGLDPQARRNLWDVLPEINGQGRTVVLTTHYLDEAEGLCNRVAILDYGRILQVGAPARMVREADAPTRIGVVSGTISSDRAHAVANGDDVSDDGTTLTISTRRPAPVLAALAERDALEGLTVQAATLEDVFLALTGREYRA